MAEPKIHFPPSKEYLHKVLVSHLGHERQYVKEIAKFDMNVLFYGDRVTTHFQVTGNLNSTKNSLLPNSKYEIFLCNLGTFDLDEGYTIEQLIAGGLVKIANHLRDGAATEYDRLVSRCGLNECDYERLPDEITQDLIESMLENGLITIKDMSDQ